MDDTKEMIVKELFETGSVMFGKFKLKSNLESPYYINLRKIPLYPKLFDAFISKVGAIISDIEVKSNNSQLAVTGVPYGATPLAVAVARDRKLPYIPIRKETKDHGVQDDPESYKHFKIILLEDVISTGSSIVETIEKLPENSVTGVIVLVDRGLGGEDRLKSSHPGVKLHSVLKINDIFTQSPS